MYGNLMKVKWNIIFDGDKNQFFFIFEETMPILVILRLDRSTYTTYIYANVIGTNYYLVFMYILTEHFFTSIHLQQ